MLLRSSESQRDKEGEKIKSADRSSVLVKPYLRSVSSFGKYSPLNDTELLADESHTMADKVGIRIV
jgi:hypothetical protein